MAPPADAGYPPRAWPLDMDATHATAGHAGSSVRPVHLGLHLLVLLVY